MAAPDPIRGGTAKLGLCPKTEAAPHPILTVEGARYRQFDPQLVACGTALAQL
jgi:hypothetical protein